MKRQALLRWQHGDQVVLVELDGTDLVISLKEDGVVQATLALPASRSLLIGLREACIQALRGMQ